MLKKILIAIAAIVVVFVVVVAMQPSEFRITRMATISAPPASGFCAGERFPQLGDMVPVGETRSRS